MLNRNKTYLKKETFCIDSILEIRLNAETWKRITRIAKIKKKSYSWVVRYAVFRLINRKNPVKYIQGWTSVDRHRKFKELNEIIKNGAKRDESTSKMHRHKLCLYGDDELFIRLSAAMLHCTMTHLVRLAMEWNLSELERRTFGKSGRFHRSSFFWLGIKLFQAVELHSLNTSERPLKLIRFDGTDYW